MTDDDRLERIEKKIDLGFLTMDGRMRSVEQIQPQHELRLSLIEKRPGPIRLVMQTLGLLSLFLGVIVGIIKVSGVV